MFEDGKKNAKWKLIHLAHEWLEASKRAHVLPRWLWHEESDADGAGEEERERKLKLPPTVASVRNEREQDAAAAEHDVVRHAGKGPPRGLGHFHGCLSVSGEAAGEES